MLASDMNNREFTNPLNPDDLLHVEFYMHAPLDPNKSQIAGKAVYGETVPFVRIMRPGDNTSIIETPVRNDHKARWPQRWLAFQMKEGMIEGAIDVPGWKIEEWAVINESQVHELKYLRFSTVEQIAGASDAQIQRLGIGGLGLREQARQALKDKYQSAARMELETRDRQIAELSAQLLEIKAMLKGTAPPPTPISSVVVEQPAPPPPQSQPHQRHLSPEHIEKMLQARREKKEKRERLRAIRKEKKEEMLRAQAAQPKA